MKCKEFQHWLTSRDIYDTIMPQEAADHMAVCKACEILFHCDSRLEYSLKKGFQMEAPPRGLAEQISVSLDHQTQSGPSRVAIAAGASLVCLFILFAVTFFPFSSRKIPEFKDLNQISRQAVKGHLAGNRYMSFTADNVGPALEALTKNLGFQVLLPDFNDFGCTLIGGRLCALGKCRAAYFVLEKNGRSGSLYIMDTQFLSSDMADGSRFNTRIKGCEANVWIDNGQIYAMVF